MQTLNEYLIGKTVQKNYAYKAYGLNINSEILLPELGISNGKEGIAIKYGYVPTTLGNGAFKGVRFEATADEFILKVDGVARYYVFSGKEIIIEPFSGAKEDDIRLFLLGSVFAALLHQRGYLALHGSAINYKGKCVVFTGVSGAGKSTIAAAFAKKGYPVLSDDVCAVEITKDCTPMVVPSFPRLKLWADAVEKLGEDTNALSRIREQMDKYNMPLETGFSSESLPFYRLYILSETNASEVKITKLEKQKKIEALINNTYRMRFLQGQGGKARHFNQCMAVAKNIDIYQIERPNGSFILDELVYLLEGALAK